MIPEVTDNTNSTIDTEDTHQPVAEGLDDEGIFAVLQDWYRVDSAHSAAWRKQAKADFDFVAGKQWDEKDESKLRSEKRPVITFNRTLPIIKAVCGLEVNSRQETIYLPRNTEAGQVRANEILTAASQWMSDGCDAEDEQSEAFADTVVCGMGWTELRVEYDEDPEGMYVESRISPLEMVWDHTSTSKNLQDSRRRFRVKEMQLSEAREMFPGEDDVDLDAGHWAYSVEGDKEGPKPVEERRLKLGHGEEPSAKDKVRIVHAQWFETEDYFRVADPMSGQLINMEVAELDELKARTKELGYPMPEAAPMKRRVYKQAFLGGKVLGGVRPNLSSKGFTFQCITGQPDRNTGTFYGLVAVMRDPQMWGNKWLSQTLHILNTTAKGGILAETDAFEDQRDAQDTYAQPDAITWVKKGAIAGGKIMQKPGVGLPTGYVNLLQFAVDSIPQVTGINMEMMGLRDVNQPGVLEAHRKQSAMTILAPLMDSKRRYMKNIGRVRLDLIQRYFSDGRLIRIAGPDGVQELRPLLRDETSGDYEVIVDDAPTSPNSKEQTWATIQQVMPVFKEMLTPEAVMTIMEYSPLPSKLIGAFRDMMNKPPGPEEQEMQQFQKQAAVADETRKQAESDAKVQKDRASADRTRIQGITDLITAGVKVADAEIKAAEAMAIPGDPGRTGADDDGNVIDPQQEPQDVRAMIARIRQMQQLPTSAPAVPAPPILPTEGNT